MPASAPPPQDDAAEEHDTLNHSRATGRESTHSSSGESTHSSSGEETRERLRALLTLERLPGFGPVRVRALLDESPDPSVACARAAAMVARSAAARAAVSAGDALRLFDELVRLCPELSPMLMDAHTPGFPRRLRDLPDPPPTLFSLGNLALLDRPCVAIVGTRRCTRYGERIARALSGSLARAGACVVSGLASGIDGVAHRAALEHGGATAAVLGTGIDVPYPAAHRALHAEVAAHGLVLSEHPPGERAGPGAFPRRNRIIAALAELTIVVEAGARSGALITAGHALELGRAVAAVPGPIDASESAGSNALLRDGAHVIADVTDALALLGLTPPPRRTSSGTSNDARAVYEALGTASVQMDELSQRLSIPVERCLVAITELELAGTIVCELTGEVSRRI